MIAIMWQFEIKQGCKAEFEQLYGVEGEWTAMNRHSRSYLGTSFLHDQNRASRYILIEYWSEMLVYEQYRTYQADAIASLEERSRALVESVEPLGIFSALDVPDRFGPTWSQRR
jgi:hypothetical protein